MPRQYVDPVVSASPPSPEGMPAEKNSGELRRRPIDDDEVDAEIADLQRQLAEAKRRKKRKKFSDGENR